MYSTESSLKYFIVQAIASSLFIFRIIISSINDSFIISIIINSALLIKIGSAPFHFWFPEIIEGQKWIICLILLTIQKISPIILINYNINFPLFFFIIILSNIIIRALIGLNQVRIRKILTFSSINHIGWIIASLIYIKIIWLTYFIIYTFILINIIIVLNTFKIYYIKQIINMNTPKIFNLIFIINFFRLAGLPPFIGFLPKWLTIQIMIGSSPLLVSLIVVLTLFTIFYYIRTILTNLILMLTHLNTNWKIRPIITFSNFFRLFILPLTCIIFIT